MDPCKVANQLELEGLDFTIHVVGFYVATEKSSGLHCLARNTDGEYFSAGDASQLREVLTSTVREIEKSLKTVQLRALDEKGGQAITSSKLPWTVTERPSGNEVYSSDTISQPSMSLETGRYRAEASLNNQTKEPPSVFDRTGKTRSRSSLIGPLLSSGRKRLNRGLRFRSSGRVPENRGTASDSLRKGIHRTMAVYGKAA